MSPTAKVIYKPDTQSTGEYIVLVEPDEYKKWKDDPTTTELTKVVELFEIFYSFQGGGLYQTPSNQQLESDFEKPEDKDDFYFYKQILERGHLKEQHVEGKKDATVCKKEATVKNVTRSNATLDTRGMRNNRNGI